MLCPLLKSGVVHMREVPGRGTRGTMGRLTWTCWGKEGKNGRYRKGRKTLFCAILLEMRIGLTGWSKVFLELALTQHI